MLFKILEIVPYPLLNFNSFFNTSSLKNVHLLGGAFPYGEFPTGIKQLLWDASPAQIVPGIFQVVLGRGRHCETKSLAYKRLIIVSRYSNEWDTSHLAMYTMETSEGLKAQLLQLRPQQISVMVKNINVYQTLVTISQKEKNENNMLVRAS